MIQESVESRVWDGVFILGGLVHRLCSESTLPKNEVFFYVDSQDSKTLRFKC